MGLMGRRDGGFADVIRCDEHEYLIWKWRPKGNSLEASHRANSIRWGSMLRVRDGSVAVFVYTGEDGKPQEFIEGPFDGALTPENMPILGSLLGALYEGESPFQAEVYFINLAELIQLKFGVPYFDVYDVRLIDVGVPVAVRGSIFFKIEDYRKFISLHRLDQFDMNDFRSQARDMISRVVKSCVANAPEDYGIPIGQLERRIVEINDIVEDGIRSNLESDFGVSVRRVDVSEIELKKDSEGYKALQAAVNNKVTRGMNAARNAVDSLDLQRMGAKRMKSAMADRIARPVRQGRATSEPAGRHAQPATPSAVSQVADAARNAANGLFGAIGGFVGRAHSAAPANASVGQTTPPPIGAVPPPIPVTTYYVAIGAQQTGPYTIDQLTEMSKSGALVPSTLVWCEGMAQWSVAREVSDLVGLFE